MAECVFCNIVRGETETDLLYQDDEVTAFRDRNPVAPVHVLIIPNRHIPSAAKIELSDASLVGKLFVVGRQVAEDLGVAEGYRLVVNSGGPAGQSVFHLHLHLLAGRRFGWPPG
jgi:histidine triad (HIT) family protein